MREAGGRGDGDEEGDIPFVAIAGIFAHVGFLREGPLDFRSGEARGEFPVEGGRDSDHTGILPICMEAGEMVNVKSDGEGLASGDAAVFRDEIDRKSGAFESGIIGGQRSE